MEGRKDMGRDTLEQFTLFDMKEEVLIGEKEHSQVCLTCKESLPLKSFNTKGKFKKINLKTNKRFSYLDKVCKKCDSIERQDRKKREYTYGKPPKDYCCPICERNEKQIKNNLIMIDEEYTVHERDFKYPAWVIDHDHDTGEFRGWLCSNCNTGLGAMGDNKEGLKKAMRYLEGDSNDSKRI